MDEPEGGDGPTIEELAARHEELAARHEELATRQEQIAAVVQALADTVGRLAALRPGQGAGRSRAPEVEAEELVDWVAWLARRYEIGSVIPKCWPLHGAMVDELAALRLAWLSIGDSPTVAAQWHVYLDSALDRMDGRWRTCIDSTHRESWPARWLEEGAEGADEIDLTRPTF